MSCEAADYTHKRGDTVHDLTVVLSDDDGPIDLTSASSIVLVLTHRKTRTRETFAMSVVGAATDGRVEKTWAANEPSVEGDFDAEYQITFGVGQVLAVPSSGTLLYRIDTLD